MTVERDLEESQSFATLVSKCPPLRIAGLRSLLRHLVQEGEASFDWNEPDQVVAFMFQRTAQSYGFSQDESGEWIPPVVIEDDSKWLNEVLNLIRLSPVTTAQIMAATKKPRTSVRRALRSLETSSLVERIGEGNNTKYRQVQR